MGDLSVAIMLQFVRLNALARFENDPGGHGLAEPGVGHPGDGDFGDGRMAVQELFNLRRIDVFTAANDQFTAAAYDPEVAIVAAPGEIAGMKPAIAIDRPGGGLRV